MWILFKTFYMIAKMKNENVRGKVIRMKMAYGRYLSRNTPIDWED